MPTAKNGKGPKMRLKKEQEVDLQVSQIVVSLLLLHYKCYILKMKSSCTKKMNELLMRISITLSVYSLRAARVQLWVL